MIVCLAAIASSGCKKSDNTYSPLRDLCRMQNDAGFRAGRWKLIRVDSQQVNMDASLNFYADSFFVEEFAGAIDPDTTQFRLAECNWMVVRSLYQGQLDGREFGIEVRYSPQDSVFSIAHDDVHTGRRVVEYQKQ